VRADIVAVFARVGPLVRAVERARDAGDRAGLWRLLTGR
jgi:hypothetical protein